MKKFKLAFKLFGVFTLVAGLGVGVYMVGQRQFIGTRANPQEQPKEVKITNLTENSFSVSWVTDAPTIASVIYSTNPSSLDLTAVEDRASTASTIHHISIKPAKPATAYFFEIISGGSRYDNSGQPYEAVTPQTLSVPPPPETIYGSVSGATRAIVYVEGNFTPMSVLVNASGNYSVSVSTARSKDLLSYAALDESTSLDILVVSENGKATATTTIANSSPVPTITIGQSFTFEEVEPDSFEPKTEKEKEIVSKLAGELETPPEGKFSVTEIDDPKEVALKVTNLKEGEVIEDTRPQFTGIAPPNTKLTITLQSDPITVEVTTDANGNWTWTPPTNLELGSHLINVAYAAGGETVTETVNFEVIVSPTPSSSPAALPEAGISSFTYILFLIGVAGVLAFSLLMAG